MLSLAAIALLSSGAEGAHLRYLKASRDWNPLRQDAEISRRWDAWTGPPPALPVGHRYERPRPGAAGAEAEQEEPERAPPTLDAQLRKLVARLLKRARRHAAKGEMDKARAAYEQVIGLAPASREAEEAREALGILKEEN